MATKPLYEQTLVVSAERAAIITELQKKPWFTRTHKLWQYQLLGMPSNYDGFLRSLADRPEEEVGNAEVIKIVDVHPFPHNFIGIVFEVKSPEGSTYTYEYISSSHGPDTGFKAVVLVKNKKTGKVTNVILTTGDKFATAKRQVGAIGGFREGGENAYEGMLREIIEELGFTKKPKNIEIIKLSPHRTDAGMTDALVLLFAAIISEEEAKGIGVVENPDEQELEIGPFMVPVEQLPDLVENHHEGFLNHILFLCEKKRLIDPIVDSE